MPGVLGAMRIAELLSASGCRAQRRVVPRVSRFNLVRRWFQPMTHFVARITDVYMNTLHLTRSDWLVIGLTSSRIAISLVCEGTTIGGS